MKTIKITMKKKINKIQFLSILFIFICFSISLFFIPFVRELIIQSVENYYNKTLNHIYWHSRIIYVIISLFSFFSTVTIWLLSKYFFSNKKISYSKKILISIFCIISVSSLLLLLPGVYEGHDLTFHLMRIEGISNALKNREFPVRLQSIWLEGYGYPVSIYYGDILLYFPAIIHLAGASLTLSYKIYVFMINCFTVIMAYISFNLIFKNHRIACLLSLLYSTAPYRFVDIFVRCAVGEFSAFVFFPIIALAFYKIYSNELEHNIVKESMLLSIGMSGLILTHILSAEIVVIFLILICILLWKKTFTKPVLLSILIAVIFTLLLCAGFIIPFLDYYINVPVQINNVVNKHIQKYGVYFKQLFLFFQNPYGTNSTILNERMLFSPGLPIIIGMIISSFYFVKIQKDKQLLFFLILSVISILLASNIFPYDFQVYYL